VSDLPPEAAGRVLSQAFSSALSVNDFAACLHMGLRPVALVQGYCVMRWTYSGTYGYYQPYTQSATTYGGLAGSRPGLTGGGPFQGGRGYFRPAPNTLTSYQCPHYYSSAEHRSWGYNYEQRWLTQTWHDGFNQAYQRMLEEAAEAGAHGVIGVVDTARSLIDQSLREFHIYGTAVVAEGQKEPGSTAGIWTSYLAGQRLAKLIEAGFMPTSVTAAMASVRVWAVCLTVMGMRGYGGVAQRASGFQPAGPINQLADAEMQARRLVRDHVKAGMGSDALQGADLRAAQFEMGEGDMEVDCVLRGTRVRRFRPADPLPPPQIVVRVND
jgi:hypothetical protein